MHDWIENDFHTVLILVNNCSLGTLRETLTDLLVLS